VAITGAGLAAVHRVTVGGNPVEFHALAPNRLTFVTPAHEPGPVTVTVTSRFGTSTPGTYTFVTPGTTSKRPAPTRATPGTAAPGHVVRGSTPRVGAPPTLRRTPPSTHDPGLATAGDRVGDYWYLVGRLLTERADPAVNSCVNAQPDGFTGCLARTVLLRHQVRAR
jgi:hypothetical protein